MMRRWGTMTKDPSPMNKMPRRLNLIRKSLYMGSRYPLIPMRMTRLGVSRC